MPSSTVPGAWRLTPRATCSSPTGGITASAGWTRLRASSAPSRAQLLAASRATAGPPPAPNWPCPRAWRWTLRGTCSSPTCSIAASAGWTEPRASSPRWWAPAAGASLGMAGPPRRPNWPCPQAWRWTPRAISTLPIRATTGSGRSSWRPSPSLFTQGEVQWAPCYRGWDTLRGQ